MTSSKHTFFAFVLAVPLIVCALVLVSNQNKHRKLFVNLEKELSHSKQMDIEYAQLQLEHSFLSKQSRIAEKAKGELSMVPISPNRIDYVSLTNKP